MHDKFADSTLLFSTFASLFCLHTMLVAQQHAVLGRRSAGFAPSRCAVPAARLVIRRFRENQQGSSPLEQQQKSKTDTPLSPEQLEQVYSKKPGDISPQTAEMRADLGNAATDFSQLQAFDGPIAETVNGRLAMIGAVLGLIEEASTKHSLWQQVADHPWRVIAVVLAIGAATVVPVLRGYTRKEGFVNTFGGLPWIPLAENWNGRLAMLGFAGMLFSEGVLHMNTLQAWGLQSLH